MSTQNHCLHRFPGRGRKGLPTHVECVVLRGAWAIIPRSSLTHSHCNTMCVCVCVREERGNILKMNIVLSKYEITSATCAISNTQCCQSVRPQTHRIVRLLDRTIGCDLANVRPIANVCYDLQKRSHTAIGIFCWWYFIVRLVVRVVARSTPIGEDR